MVDSRILGTHPVFQFLCGSSRPRTSTTIPLISTSPHRSGPKRDRTHSSQLHPGCVSGEYYGGRGRSKQGKKVEEVIRMHVTSERVGRRGGGIDDWDRIRVVGVFRGSKERVHHGGTECTERAANLSNVKSSSLRTLCVSVVRSVFESAEIGVDPSAALRTVSADGWWQPVVGSQLSGRLRTAPRRDRRASRSDSCLSPVTCHFLGPGRRRGRRVRSKASNRRVPKGRQGRRNPRIQ